MARPGRAGRGVRRPQHQHLGARPTTARSRASPRPARPASACASSSTTARASPTPAPSTRPSSLEALAEARDNATFGEPDEFNGLATPDGVEAADLDLWPEHLADVPTADKVGHGPRARGGHHGPRPPRHRRRVGRCSATRSARARSPPAPASGPGAGPGRATSMVQALAVQDGETQIAGGLLGGPRRSPTCRSTRRPTTPCSAPPACSAPPSRPPSGSPWCSSPA